MKKLTKKKRRKIIAWTVVLELILAALVTYGVYSGALQNSLVEGTVIVMLLLIPVLLVTLLVAVLAGSRAKKTVIVQAASATAAEPSEEEDGTGFDSYVTLDPLAPRHVLCLIEVPDTVTEMPVSISVIFDKQEYTISK